MLSNRTTVQDARLYDKITKMETIIIDQLSELRKFSRANPCHHFMQISDSCEPYEPTQNYYNKFWQLYLKSQTVRHKLASMAEQIEGMSKEVHEVQDLSQKLEKVKNQNLQFKKKVRRRADDINRECVCPVKDCFRAYGSDLALKVHLKKKHGEEPKKHGEQPRNNEEQPRNAERKTTN